MSHTPGPWRVIPEHEMVVGAGDATVVYELNTNEDDARLIAAAPELLEALKDVAQTLAWMQNGKCRGFSDGLLSTQDALDKARVATNKATGEQV